MLLIAGLGNKGCSYKLNRHNLGFMVVDYLVNYLNSANFENKFDSLVSTFMFEDNKVLFIKPQTFMNLSGRAISSASSFYKIPIDNIIIIYDDIDLPLGKLRYKVNSSSGGHNGIRSIQNYIGNNFHRIKIGIGRPKTNQEIANYVLSNFSKNELEDTIILLLQKIANNVSYLLRKDFKSFVERINKE